jgi:hypothetical protein
MEKSISDVLIKKYTDAGVKSDKITVTDLPSIVVYSISRKRIIHGIEDTHELIEENGNFRLSIENNRFVSLHVYGELDEYLIDKINKSDGIIATNAVYDKPHFRFGFIPMD